MHLNARKWFSIGAVFVAGIATGVAIDHREVIAKANIAASRELSPEEVSFLAQNSTAMNQMMSGMMVDPTGDIDRDFVAMMSAHHQGAIDMAQTLLRYGHNEMLRRLAQEIIVTQQQEIAMMQLAVGASLPRSMPAPDQISAQGEGRP